MPLLPRDPDAKYEEFARFEIGGKEVHLEAAKEELFLCLPEGCVSVPATGDSVAKWLTFFEVLAGKAEDHE